MTMMIEGGSTGNGTVWNHSIPSVTASCLVAGNVSTDLAVTACCGLSTGRVQIWGEESRSSLVEADMGETPGGIKSSAIQSLACLNIRGVRPRIGVCNAAGQLGLFELTSHALNRVALTKPHQSCVNDVVINNHGKSVLASCSEQGNVVMSSLDDLRELGRLQQTEDGVCINSLLFWTLHDLCIAGSSPCRALRIWDTRQRTTSTTISSHSGDLTSLAYHPSLPYQIVSGDRNGGLSVFDLRTCKQTGFLPNAHRDTISAVKFHPDKSNILLSASNDGTIKSFDLDNSSETIVDSHGVCYNSLDICSDEVVGPLLMACAEDESLTVKALYQTL